MMAKKPNLSWITKLTLWIHSELWKKLLRHFLNKEFSVNLEASFLQVFCRWSITRRKTLRLQVCLQLKGYWRHLSFAASLILCCVVTADKIYHKSPSSCFCVVLIFFCFVLFCFIVFLIFFLFLFFFYFLWMNFYDGVV